MRFPILLLWTLAAQAVAAPTVEVFTDKGSTFVRAGTRQGLAVGSELVVTTDESGAAPVGRASVLEVWESTARVSLDRAAAKANAAYALLPRAHADAVSRGAGSGTLKGHLESNGARVSIYNDSDERWTRCELRISGDCHAILGEVSAHDQNGIMWFKFDGPEVARESLLVSCDEGETRFRYDDPRAPGKLRGHVERNVLGRINVFNDSEVGWHRCLLKQPDGTHYLLDKLDAHSSEGVMGIKFTKDAPPATYVDVGCDQGRARFNR